MVEILNKDTRKKLFSFGNKGLENPDFSGQFGIKAIMSNLTAGSFCF
jgi:hypothetical protein